MSSLDSSGGGGGGVSNVTGIGAGRAENESETFGQLPSTISVLHVIRNELLGILKRAADRGQILDHCNIELMVEEAMLESNLVQSVDEILITCNSSSSQSIPMTTTTTTTKARNSETMTQNEKRNLQKIKMLSTLSKKMNEASRTVSLSPRSTKKEAHYMVKKIIFDGLEELTYKYVTASSSGNDSSDDDASGESTSEKRDDMIKFIQTPKMIFGGSSSRELNFAATKSKIENKTESEVIDDSNEQKVAQKNKENISMMNAKGAYDSSVPPFEGHHETKLKKKTTTKNSANDEISQEKSCPKLTRSIMRMNEIWEAARKPLWTVYKAKKFDSSSSCNRKVRRVSSCIVVKSMQSMETVDRSKEIDDATICGICGEVKILPPAEPQATTLNTKETVVLKRSCKGTVKDKTNGLRSKFTNIRVNYKASPLKITLLKSKLHHVKPESKAKSIKCKLSRIVSETVPNDNEKVKKEIHKMLGKCSKSEAENLHPMKKSPAPKSEQEIEMVQKAVPADKRLEQEGTETTQRVQVDKQPTPKELKASQQQAEKQKQESPPLTEKKQQKKSLTAAMSPSVTDTKRTELLAAMGFEIKSEQATQTLPATGRDVAMSNVHVTESSTRNVKQQTSRIFQFQAKATVENTAKIPPRSEEQAALKAKLYEARMHDRLIAAKIKKEKLRSIRSIRNQEAFTPDFQARMLTAEWLSIAKQLKREQLPQPFSCVAATPSDDWVPEAQQQTCQEEAQLTPAPAAATIKPFNVVRTPSMKSNWSTLGEKWRMENEKAEEEPPVKCESPKTLKPTWSSLVRKWETEAEKLKMLELDAEQNNKQQTTQAEATLYLSSKSTSSTLCAKSLQSVLTLVPQEEDDSLAESLSNGSNISTARSISSMRGEHLASEKKAAGSDFKKQQPLTDTTVLEQRRDNFLRTVEAMSFMLDASDTVRAISDGLDEQDLRKFRWNLEYQKREEEKRKAGKNDVATTMLTSITGPALNEVETQTETPAEPTTLPPLNPTALLPPLPPPPPPPLPQPAIVSNKLEEGGGECTCSPNKKASLNKGLEQQQSTLKSKSNKDSNTATNDSNPAMPFTKPKILQQPLQTAENELLSKDYFSALLEEIRELLQTTNELSAKAFSSEPLSLWDVREAGRKVAQLTVVKTSLSAKRFNFFVNIERALEKQIDVMKTIVAYGRIIYPNETSADPLIDEQKLRKLLIKYQLIATDAQTSQTQRCANNRKVPQPPSPPPSPIQRTNMETNEGPPKMSTEDYEQQQPQQQQQQQQQQHQPQLAAKSSTTHTQRLSRPSTQRVAPAQELHRTAQSTNYASQESSQHAVSASISNHPAAANAYHPHISDHISEMSSEYARKIRHRKTIKRAKKPKPAPKPYVEFRLSGLKQNTNNVANTRIHDLHRQYHEQLRHLQRNQLLSSPHTKRLSAKRSKKMKSKSTMDSVSTKMQPITERIPAKNAPYKRTSYILPVPPHQSPTNWELFRWNCGNLNERPSFYAADQMSAQDRHQQHRKLPIATKLECKSHHRNRGLHHPAPVWK